MLIVACFCLFVEQLLSELAGGVCVWREEQSFGFCRFSFLWIWGMFVQLQDRSSLFLSHEVSVSREFQNGGTG